MRRQNRPERRPRSKEAVSAVMFFSFSFWGFLVPVGWTDTPNKALWALRPPENPPGGALTPVRRPACAQPTLNLEQTLATLHGSACHEKSLLMICSPQSNLC